MYLRGVKCLAIVAAMGAIAAAEPKPKIAIRIDGKERETATTADAFETALRKLAAAKSVGAAVNRFRHVGVARAHGGAVSLTGW